MTELYSQLGLSARAKYPRQSWLNLMEISSALRILIQKMSSYLAFETTGRETGMQFSLQKPTTTCSKCEKMSYYLTATSPLLVWQSSKVQLTKGLIIVYSSPTIDQRWNTCLLARSLSPLRATKVTQYPLLMALFITFFIVERLFALTVQVQAGMPVIYSKASSGESPLALQQDPICLHQDFYRTSGQSQMPLTILRQMKLSLCVGMRSSMMTRCFQPLQKSSELQAPQVLVYEVSTNLGRRVALACLLQRRQKTEVRQENSMLSWMKLVRSVYYVCVQILVRLVWKLKRTESRKDSFQLSLNLSSSKSCSRLLWIMDITFDLRFQSQVWEKIDFNTLSSGISWVQPQKLRSFSQGTSMSLERMRGKEQVSPIIAYQQSNAIIFHNFIAFYR